MITDALRALKEKSRFFDTIWEVAVGWPAGMWERSQGQSLQQTNSEGSGDVKCG